jgi:hypothetical protein
MRYEKRPGRTGMRHRPKQSINENEITLSHNEKLGVVLPNEFEQSLIDKVMRRLPGLPVPRIMVLLDTPKQPVADDAQRLANEHREPVAICDTEGQLLAYRMPQ